jgi:hypothetical protein
MANEQNVERVLDKIDPDKRQFIGKLIGTTAFVAPLVASFTVDSLNVADALPANGSILG